MPAGGLPAGAEHHRKIAISAELTRKNGELQNALEHPADQRKAKTRILRQRRAALALILASARWVSCSGKSPGWAIRLKVKSASRTVLLDSASTTAHIGRPVAWPGQPHHGPGPRRQQELPSARQRGRLYG